MDLGGEGRIILGDDWLVTNKATLNFETKVCTLSKGSNIFTLSQVQSPSQTQNPVLTAMNLRRHIAHGGHCFMVHVVDSGISPIRDSTGFGLTGNHPCLHKSVELPKGGEFHTSVENHKNENEKADV